MLTRCFLKSAALFATAFLVSGCLNSDSGSNDPVSDEGAIEYVMANDAPEFADVDARFFDDGSDAAAAPIATERWRREVLHREKSAHILIEKPDEGPATASVEISGSVTGLLHLWSRGEDPEGSVLEVTKDFDDSGNRSLYFERDRSFLSERHRGWKLKALSGVEIASDGASRAINSVRIQTGDVDELITGVSELVSVEELVALPMRGEVTVTVETGDAEDSVFLHLRHHRRRLELESNGDGTFTGSFHTGLVPNDRPNDRPGKRYRPRHFAIDVLSNGTLYDDVAPYDNVVWGIPYVIERPVIIGSGN